MSLSLIFSGKSRFWHSWSTRAEGRHRGQGKWGNTLGVNREQLRRQIRNNFSITSMHMSSMAVTQKASHHQINTTLVMRS